MPSTRSKIKEWWTGLNAENRRLIIRSTFFFVICICLAFTVSYLAGSPKGSQAGKRFERRLAAEQLELKRSTLSAPQGLLLYLKLGGRLLKVEDHTSLGLWWGGRLAAIGFIALLVTLPIWGSMQPKAEPIEPSAPVGRVFIAALCLIMTLAAFLRVQRLEGPLLRDEQDTLKRNVWGIIVEKTDGTREFQPAGWQQAFFENGGANNPIFFSLTARLSLAVWRAVFGAPEDRFSLSALRMPSLIAGVFAVGAVALLGWRLGFPLAGLSAALLLAIHPWHIRYSVEARGYSLAILWTIVGWIFLSNALRDQRWRSWILFSATQMLLLYSYSGAVYVAAVQTFGALFFLVSHRRFSELPRLLVPVAVSGLLYTQLMLPCVPQILNYLSKDTSFGPMDASWAAETLGAFTAGVNLGIYQGEPPPEFAPVWDLRTLPLQNPLLALVISIVVVGFLTGFALLWRSHDVGKVLILIMVSSPLLAFMHNKITGHYLYPWYLIYALPALVLCVALALTWPGERRLWKGSQKKRLLLACSPTLVFVSLFLAAVPKAWYCPVSPSAGPHELWRGANRIVIYPEGYVLQSTQTGKDNAPTTD